ncbi:MAG: dihydrolipoyl dehydrogenase [Mariprofundales bacterium]
MPIDVFMTQLSPTMKDGKIACWLKKEGDILVAGDVLAEIETDKATMEIEVVDEGVLHRILAPAGSISLVGVPIAIIAEDGEEIADDYMPEGVNVDVIASEAELTPTETTQDSSTPSQEDEKSGLFCNGETDTDVLIIGAGPGGYVAAIRAAQLGMKTTVIESTHLGGICLNWGCIPTKALLRTAEVANVLRDHGKELGIEVQGMKTNQPQAIKRSRRIANRLNKGIGFLFKKNNINHINGYAKFTADNDILVTDNDGNETRLRAKHVIIATGARARSFPNMEVDEKVVITYKQALACQDTPSEMLIIGSGAIGMEFAYFYNAMGSKVTVLEMAAHALPLEDIECAAVVEKAFKKQGIQIITNAQVNSVRNESGKALVQYTDSTGKAQQANADVALLAVGVTGNIENIGLEHTKVATERGAIIHDDFYQTAHAGIYAIGDVAGPPWLAHVASHEGIVCIESIAGLKPHLIDYDNVPGCTYCQPQVGSVGMTEEQAQQAGYNIKVGRFPYQANGKALGLAETTGLVKQIFDADTGALLGAHIVGAEATEMITSLGLARTLETTEAELMHHMFPHPTLSEMLHEATLDAYDRAIHI